MGGLLLYRSPFLAEGRGERELLGLHEFLHVRLLLAVSARLVVPIPVEGGETVGAALQGMMIRAPADPLFCGVDEPCLHGIADDIRVLFPKGILAVDDLVVIVFLPEFAVAAEKTIDGDGDVGLEVTHEPGQLAQGVL